MRPDTAALNQGGLFQLQTPHEHANRNPYLHRTSGSPGFMSGQLRCLSSGSLTHRLHAGTRHRTSQRVMHHAGNHAGRLRQRRAGHVCQHQCGGYQEQRSELLGHNPLLTRGRAPPVLHICHRRTARPPPRIPGARRPRSGSRAGCVPASASAPPQRRSTAPGPRPGGSVRPDGPGRHPSQRCLLSRLSACWISSTTDWISAFIEIHLGKERPPRGAARRGP